MGKKLIIKGADFSENGMPSVVLDWQNLSIENGGINLIPSNTAYGQNTSDQQSTRKRSVSNIYIPAGGRLHIKGLNSNSNKTLRFDACFYITDARNNTGGNVAGTLSNGISANYFPMNSDGSKDEVVLENTANNGYYYGLVFCAINKTDSISSLTFTLMYAFE
jgi:hypothetical protein